LLAHTNDSAPEIFISFVNTNANLRIIIGITLKKYIMETSEEKKIIVGKA
jgi:hypothetical protein